MSFPLARPLAAALEQALNNIIELDPAAQDALSKLDGQSFAIAVQAPAMRIRLEVADLRIKVASDDETPAATEVSGTLAALATLAARVEGTGAGQVHISGDASNAQRFQKFFATLNPDWEEPLSRVFGDVIGYQLAQALRNVFQWAASASRNLADNASEYLREESRQLMNRPELEAFYDEVDDLRDAVDLLEKRIQALGAK